MIDKVGTDKALNEEETIKNKKDSSEFSREELEILPPALLSKEKLLGTAGLQVKKKTPNLLECQIRSEKNKKD